MRCTGDKVFHGQIILGLRKPACRHIEGSENSLETYLNVSLSKGGTFFQLNTYCDIPLNMILKTLQLRMQPWFLGCVFPCRFGRVNHVTHELRQIALPSVCKLKYSDTSLTTLDVETVEVKYLIINIVKVTFKLLYLWGSSILDVFF